MGFGEFSTHPRVKPQHFLWIADRKEHLVRWGKNHIFLTYSNLQANVLLQIRLVHLCDKGIATLHSHQEDKEKCAFLVVCMSF